MGADVTQEEYEEAMQLAIEHGACAPTPGQLEIVLKSFMKGNATYTYAAEKGMAFARDFLSLRNHVHNEYCLPTWKIVIKAAYRDKGFLETYKMLWDAGMR